HNALKNESGVHRVQRIPKTEKGGRIHTSTATVAVLPKVPPTEMEIDPKDFKVDTFRASSHGGQHVQKVETAVRITHLPTGTIATCQDERSQVQNRRKAMEILRSKLYQMMQKQQKSSVDELRRKQVKSAERAEKIRTWNFPNNKVTDHRLNIKVIGVKEILDGNLNNLLQKVNRFAK
ncbi:unnamed protein product, partial [marine sediment metagenome]